MKEQVKRWNQNMTISQQPAEEKKLKKEVLHDTFFKERNMSGENYLKVINVNLNIIFHPLVFHLITIISFKMVLCKSFPPPNCTQNTWYKHGRTYMKVTLSLCVEEPVTCL